MYRNLIAELARAGIKRKQLAEGLGISSSALHARLMGKVEKDFSDAEKSYICSMVGVKPSEEVYGYLFARYAAA